MNVRVKICGIREIASAEAAITAGADFLGFNFVPTSKRVISPQKAKEVITRFRGHAAFVGVFQDQSIDEVNAIAHELGLDFVQLHGSEDKEFFRALEVPIIKAVVPTENFDAIDTALNLAHANISYFLIDRVNRGEGDMIPFDIAAELAQTFPLFYAGALTPENVSEVVTQVRPFAVDVAGGIETNGVIDLEKVKTFIANAKGANV